MSDSGASTILCVDDEPGILSALRRLFRPHGYRLLMAESGAAGLEMLEKESVDLVISDMRMPGMDGAVFLNHVRTRWPDVMRILLTGYADITSAVAAINEGGIYRYIAKPWDDDEIVLVAREALERGRLEAENRRLNALTQSQNEELKALNAGLEQKVAERTSELQDALGELKSTFLATVQAFAGMAELRSGSAGAQFSGHGRRVAEHACSVGRELGMDDSQLHAVMLAGLLHDVGKIGLPDALFGKPFNSLSAEQRAQLMKHPVVGQNLLMSIGKLRDCALLVRHHHELYDGSGYPDQLAGLAIPLGSRILAVVSDYDALQMGTLVQRPLSPDEALGFLLDNRGKRYDPQVVDCFARLVGAPGRHTISERPVRPGHLRPGMALTRELIHQDGYLLLARGGILTADVIGQLVKLESAEQHAYTLYIREGEV